MHKYPYRDAWIHTYTYRHTHLHLHTQQHASHTSTYRRLHIHCYYYFCSVSQNISETVARGAKVTSLTSIANHTGKLCNMYATNLKYDIWWQNKLIKSRKLIIDVDFHKTSINSRYINWMRKNVCVIGNICSICRMGIIVMLNSG
jgi:hypothetical protein